MAPELSLFETRALLKAQFEGQDPAQHGEKWDQLWKDNVIPWDNESPNPALIDILNERDDLASKKADGSRKKALVAGCGKGYDVLLLSAMGYDAYGLDISETGLQGAKDTEKEKDGKGLYEPKDGIEKGNVTWIAGDFFKDDFLTVVNGEKSFDLIYDYTFGCALPPSLRPAWSKRYHELLSPEGRLICLEFPTTKSPSIGGPPWAMPPRIYEGHLSRPGEVLPYNEEDCELEVEKLGLPHKNGLRRIAHFHPKRTNRGGYDADGKINDWVSVWSH
ncbi:hypothetical protein BGAL_0302g00050 [Botrytis galanthina]|uniref:Methyltransferase domain-containing protein n=1 Tax=Botrytis galanthina TaxID=278940 RepID=A0A4S8QQY8_9HELO|nr:hypothetical protein BGAL_0302g00050 [Botrytis galanthina]